MDIAKQQQLKQELTKIRRRLDMITDRQEREDTLKIYAKLICEIIEMRKLKVDGQLQ